MDKMGDYREHEQRERSGRARGKNKGRGYRIWEEGKYYILARYAPETVINRDSPEGEMSKHPKRGKLRHTSCRSSVADVCIHRRGMEAEC